MVDREMQRSNGFRKRPHLAVLLFCLAAMTVASKANAGIWKGDVSHRGSPAAGATVTICGKSDTTSNSGRFRITEPDNKKSCTIKVIYQGEASSEVEARPRPYLSLSLRSSSKGWVVEIK